MTGLLESQNEPSFMPLGGLLPPSGPARLVFAPDVKGMLSLASPLLKKAFVAVLEIKQRLRIVGRERSSLLVGRRHLRPADPTTQARQPRSATRCSRGQPTGAEPRRPAGQSSAPATRHA